MNNSNNMFDNNGSTPQQPNNTISNGGTTPPSISTEPVNNQNVAPMQQVNPVYTQPSPISNENTAPTPIPTEPVSPQNVTPIQQVNPMYTQPNNLNGMNSLETNPTSVNQQIIPQQNQNLSNDDELLKAFIGNNYEKITTRPFNFAGFFFGTFYMFYRKMFLYSILLFIVTTIILSFCIKNVLIAFIISILFRIVVGLLINKVYLFYAKKKINIIKVENPQKSIEELKNICSSKGGTSVGKIFIGFLAEMGIGFVILIIVSIIGLGSFVGNLFKFDHPGITSNGNTSSDGNTNSSTDKNGTLVENIMVNGYSCFGSSCTISIEDSEGTITDYTLNSSDELFQTLGDYQDYILVNIYYTSNGNKKTITNYEIYLKSNNEDISSIKTESELRDKIGLYSVGTHTDTFTLKEIGTSGFGYEDNVAYTYTDYVFVDSKNVEYEMKYINSNGTLNLTEGNKYTVTFEVVEGTFDYEFTIQSVS